MSAFACFIEEIPDTADTITTVSTNVTSRIIAKDVLPMLWFSSFSRHLTQAECCTYNKVVLKMPCIRADECIPETSCGSSKSVYCHRLKFGNNSHLLAVQLVDPRVCGIDNCRIC